MAHEAGSVEFLEPLTRRRLYCGTRKHPGKCLKLDAILPIEVITSFKNQIKEREYYSFSDQSEHIAGCFLPFCFCLSFGFDICLSVKMTRNFQILSIVMRGRNLFCETALLVITLHAKKLGRKK